MLRPGRDGLTERGLRVWLAAFFVALAIPSALLAYRAYAQMKWEVFHQYRVAAEALAARIDADLRRLVDVEEARAFADYGFLIAAGDSGTTLFRRSPLAQFPPAATVPGLVGHFQVNAAGDLSIPFVPAAGTDYARYGVDAAEYRERLASASRLRDILDRAARPRASPKPDAASVAALAEADDFADADAYGSEGARDEANVFERLSKSFTDTAPDEAASSYGRVDDLKLDATLEQKSLEQSPANRALSRQRATAPRESRKEQVAVYDFAPAREPELAAEVAAPAAGSVRSNERDRTADRESPRIRLFDSEIDPFQFERLDAGYFVMFRNVWRAGERIIQGAVIDREKFVDAGIADVFANSPLAGMSRLLVAFDADVIASTRRDAGPGTPAADALQGALLYRTRLSAPFGAIELIYSVTKLPPGSAMSYLLWISVVLVAVMGGGCYAMYRYGAAQIALYRQQQDFVSAVSHELKTPLTSIRMYSEILQAGWASDDKKAAYYAFIHDESERLSRLIANVLQLSRLGRDRHALEIATISVRELLDLARSKIGSQIEAAGFVLETRFDADALAANVEVDVDAFQQIMINLVDNAIKFTPPGAPRRLVLGCSAASGAVCVGVRDFGRGIPEPQRRRIFDLFYRATDEMTRETTGTGIGLALVRQLCRAMGGDVSVTNRTPGAEFVVRLPRARTEAVAPESSGN